MSDETRSAYSVGDIPNPRYTKHADGSSTLQVESSGGAGGGPVTIADGADVTQGALADAANTTGTAGTISGKLRGLVTLMVNLLSRIPAALGQATMANSTPVAIASNQSAVPVSDGGASLTIDSPQLPALASQQSAAGALRISGGGSTADGASGSAMTFPDNTDTARVLGTLGYRYNGTNADRERNNHEVTVLASAARTTSTNSADQTNHNARGIIITIDITAVTGIPALTFAITGKSTLANAYRTILASATLVGAGRTILKVYPGLAVAANLTANDALERLWRVEVTAGTVDSVTYSVSANYVM